MIAPSNQTEGQNNSAAGIVMTRRRFVQCAGLAVGSTLLFGASAEGELTQDDELFAHGVASGDPLPDGIILWTRVTPSPDAVPGSGRGKPTEVTCQVAIDRGDGTFRVLGEAKFMTSAAQDHTVRVDVRGLQPSTFYGYRFRVGNKVSRVGRFSTAPAAGAGVSSLRFAFVSCNHYEAGYFAAFRHLSEMDIDFVVHLGDYIYEGARKDGDQVANLFAVEGRRHEPPGVVAQQLGDYRRRYGQYRSDPDLQALHASCPFICTWDDHEVFDNYWNGEPQVTTGPDGKPKQWRDGFTDEQKERKKAAYQAYFEWMPIRLPDPEANPTRIYRAISWGNLAQISLLDLRQYRSKSFKGVLFGVQIDDPGRTILGAEQRTWLLGQLSNPTPRWKFIGSSVQFRPFRMPLLPNELTALLAATQRDVEGQIPNGDLQQALHEIWGFPAQGGEPYSPVSGMGGDADAWDGYGFDQRTVLKYLADNEIDNVVFLSGDVHSAWASEVPLEPAEYPINSPSLATEFTCTSVTSFNFQIMTDVFRFLGAPDPSLVAAAKMYEAFCMASNRHTKAVDMHHHGFSLVDVTPDSIKVEWHATDDTRSASASDSVVRAFSVGDGTATIEEAAGAAVPGL